MSSDAKRHEKDAIQPQIVTIGSRFTGYPAGFAPEKYGPKNDDTNDVLANARAALERMKTIGTSPKPASPVTQPAPTPTEPAATQVTQNTRRKSAFLAPFLEAAKDYKESELPRVCECILFFRNEWAQMPASERRDEINKWCKAKRHTLPTLTRGEWLATAKAIMQEADTANLDHRFNLRTSLIKESAMVKDNYHNERVTVISELLAKNTRRCLANRPRTVSTVIYMLLEKINKTPASAEMDALKIAVKSFIQVTPKNYRPYKIGQRTPNATPNNNG